ncbi:MAG: hypothetical protein IJ518_05420 [Clostridia bacterium]|nr:hypothetical protein [Clostridia bacterium]
MDTFIEQIVKKKKDPKEWAIILAIVMALIVVLAAALLFWAFISILLPFIVLGAGYGAWYVISAQNKEFEYCVTNGDIDIDLIIARRRRKRQVSVAGRKVEALLPFEQGMSTTNYQRIVVAAPSLAEEGLWYFTYHSKKNGNTLVVFQPDQRVLQALYSGLQKLVQIESRRAADAKGIVLDSRRTAE